VKSVSAGKSFHILAARYIIEIMMMMTMTTMMIRRTDSV